jgi:hypothetical protein
MGLFGRKGEKRAEDAAAKEEADRLVALPVEDLATAILPAFGPAGPGRDGNEIGTFQVAMFLMDRFPGGRQFVKPLFGPVGEGIQLLEHQGLVERRVRNIGGSVVSVTRAGQAAIGSDRS